MHETVIKYFSTLDKEVEIAFIFSLLSVNEICYFAHFFNRALLIEDTKCENAV